MLHRLLVATDATRAWRALLPVVRGLAERHGSEVVLFEAVPVEPEDGSRLVAMRDARRRLEEDAAALEREGLPARVEVRLGDPVPTMAQVAAATGADLVALAHRGRHGLFGWLRQSVTADALRVLSRPLLVANVRRWLRPGWGGLRRILVPLEDDAAADPVLPLVVTLAAASGAEVVLMHAAGSLPPAGMDWLPEYAAAMPPTADPAPWLDALSQRLAESGVVSRVRRALAPVTPAICACAKDEAADLVVLTTHPPVRWWDRVIGSVAERQLRLAPCPILVVPTGVASRGVPA